MGELCGRDTQLGSEGLWPSVATVRERGCVGGGHSHEKGRLGRPDSLAPRCAVADPRACTHARLHSRRVPTCLPTHAQYQLRVRAHLVSVRRVCVARCVVLCPATIAKSCAQHVTWLIVRELQT